MGIRGAHRQSVREWTNELQRLCEFVTLAGIRQECGVEDLAADQRVSRTSIERAGARLHAIDILVVDVFLRL